jgi:RimJ/RimL family protein N-acetyltransferase
MIIVGNQLHGRTLARASGCSYNPESNVVFSREKDGKLLGGVIFQAYNGASIVIQVASFDPHWLDRDMLWMSFHYPFDQLGVRKLFTQTPSNNLKALDFNRKLGFKDEARIEGVFRDADLVIRSMRREDCRWLTRGSRRGIFQ